MTTTRLSAVGVGVGLWVVCLTALTAAQPAGQYALDRKTTCGRTLTVYDRDLILEARSAVAPANPPLECIVHLESAYSAADGRSRLQIIVKQLQIDDCKVKLDLFNGRRAAGNTLRALGCGSSSTDIIYSKENTATIRFSRPLYLYQTKYSITIAVRAYEDGDAIGTEVGVDTLSVGAIIGIVVGLLVVIAIAILLGWCCCTGYIDNFLPGGGKGREAVLVPAAAPRISATNVEGSIDSNLEKLSDFSYNPHGKNGIGWEDSARWTSVSGYGQEGNGNFRRGVPRRAAPRGYANPQVDNAHFTRSGREEVILASRAPGTDRPNYGNYPARDSHVYEPYDTDNQPPQKSPRFRKRGEDPRASGRSRGSRRSRNSAPGEEEDMEGGHGGGKETVIDDPGSGSSEEEKKARLDDSDADTTTTLHREGSEVDVDTIISPMHVNAAVRASVPDLSDQPDPSSSLPNEAAPKGSPSPRSRRKHPRGGRDPDPMGLPPEAFDPVFTTPTSQEQYPGEWRPTQQQPPFPMPFMPYGMVPFVPGQQTYAYAYQTAPQVPGSYPGQQGAYFMQSVPTAEGDVQKTAFAMHSERTPKGQGKGKGGKQAHPGAPEFSSTPVALPDGGQMSVPGPDTGHRSVAVKSFSDPDSKMQTTQVLWTDNVPDPTDPKPGDSSQVTRKTTTRVTTRSGYGDLPQQTTTLLDEPDPNPAFLSPSGSRQAALPPAAITPSAANVNYYTGQRSGPPPPPPPPPQPDVVHEAPSRNRAIRDTITLGAGESSEV